MPARRLNKKLVIALTLSVFAMMVLLAVVMLRQLQHRDPKFFVDLAEQARTEGQLDQAAILYQKAWERSQDAAHLVKLGEVFLEKGDVQNTLAAWSQALIGDPNLVEAHRRRLELLLERSRLSGRIRDWQHVEEAARGMLEIEPEPPAEQKAFAHYALGLALINTASLDEANAEAGREQLETAAGLAPDVVDYPLELAGWHFRNGAEDDGWNILQRLVETKHADPASAAKVRWTFARYVAADGRTAEAEKHFQTAVELAGDDPDARREARLAYAGFLAQRWARAVRDADTEPAEEDELFQRAERILTECIEAAPQSYEPYLQLAALYKSAGRHADVLDVCRKRLDRGLVRKGVRAGRHRMNTFGLMIQASDACLLQAIEAEQQGDMAAHDRWLDEAREFAERAEGESPNHPRVLTQTGRIHVARGRLRDALKDLRAAHEAYKAFGTVDWDTVVVLARVHVQQNEPGAAREVLEGVLEEARRRRLNDPDFWTLYGQTLVETDEPERALSVADRVLLIDPDNEAALRIKAAVYERQGRRAEAGRLFEQVTGDRSVRAILTAREASLAGDAVNAVAVLQEALDENPADPRLVAALAYELINDDRREEAERVIDRALSVHPDDSRLQRMALLARGDLTPEQRDEATLALIRQEQDAYKQSLDLVSFYLSKGDSERTLEAIDDALEHLVAKDTPLAEEATLAQHRALLRAKLRTAVRAGDEAAMEEARDDAVKFNVDGVQGKTLQGLYRMAREEYEPAITDFRQVLAHQPTDVWTLTHLGQCLYAVGRPDEAKDAFERAVRINPEGALAHRGLAILAKRKGDDEALERHLDVCEKRIPNDPWVRQELLARRERQDPKAAIARREARLAEEPNDLANLERLAMLCETAGERDKADRYYERLLAEVPDSQAAAAKVAGYFRRTGRNERALEILTEYAESRPTPDKQADAHLAIAEHFQNLGETGRAEQVLLDAAERAETLNVQRGLAELYWRAADRPQPTLEWLQKAIASARTADSKTLATLLEFRVAVLLDQRINDVEAAQRAVDELLQRFPDDSRAFLFSSELHARAGRIDAAVAALNEHLTRRPGDANARFQRAKHLVSLGRLGPAIEDLEAVKRTAPLALGPEPRILLANLYERVDRKDRWLQELESLAADMPDADRAVEELVRAYLRTGRGADADRIVTARINRGDPQPQWYYLRGQVSLHLGEPQKALDDFQRGARWDDFSVVGVVRVLDALAAMGRHAEGADFCDQHQLGQRDDVLIRAHCAAVLARSGRFDDALTRLHQTMTDSLTDSPRAAPLILARLQTALPESSAVNRAIARFEAQSADGIAERARLRILSRLYREADLMDRAAETLDELVQTSVNEDERAALWQELGDVHQLAKRPERARAAYEEALKYDPNNWVTLNNLAYLLADDLNEHDEALDFARRAVARTDNPSALDTLGWIYVGLEQFPTAIAELSRAVREAPNDPLAMYHLGEAYRRSGRFDQAVNVLQSAATLARNRNDNELGSSIAAALEHARQSERNP